MEVRTTGSHWRRRSRGGCGVGAAHARHRTGRDARCCRLDRICHGQRVLQHADCRRACEIARGCLACRVEVLTTASRRLANACGHAREWPSRQQRCSRGDIVVRLTAMPALVPAITSPPVTCTRSSSHPEKANPRSWNLRRRAGRWDRGVRAFIRRAPRACRQAFWKRCWQSWCALAGLAQSSRHLALQQGSAARGPQRHSVAREGRRSPPRRHANKLLAACCFGRATAMGWRRRGKWSSMLHLLQPSTVPLDLCLTAVSIAATPLSTQKCVPGLSLAD